MSPRIPAMITTQQPRSIGRYEVYAQLATGGMATIHLVGNVGPGGFRKLFALKTIHPHLIAEEGFVEMFFDEARISSRIRHPNVCEVIEFGVEGGTHYLVMELLAGVPLSKISSGICAKDDRPADLGFVLPAIADAARGLHAAHEATLPDGTPMKIVHRDISPSNVFITFDGVAKVLDFGVASAADQIHLTRTGTLRGKFAYMAPEQLEQVPVDRRVDVWSLGVVLWELLVGRRLFRRGRQVETMRAVLDASIPAPIAVREDVPPMLSEVVMTALARDPEARLPTTGDFADRLDEVTDALGLRKSGDEIATQLRALAPSAYELQKELAASALRGELTTPETQDRDDATALAPVLEEDEPEPSSRRPLWLFVASLIAASVVGWVGYATLSDPEADSAGDRDAAVAVLDPEPTPTASVEEPRSDARQDAAAADAATTPVTLMTMAPESPGSGENRRPGHLHITTPGGWAEVAVGGRTGRTPLRLTVRSGRQRVRIRPFGMGLVRRSVVVRPGAVTRLVVPVTPP